MTLSGVDGARAHMCGRRDFTFLNFFGPSAIIYLGRLCAVFVPAIPRLFQGKGKGNYRAREI